MKAKNSLVIIVIVGSMYRKYFKSYVTCKILCSKLLEVTLVVLKASSVNSENNDIF